jgi:molybdopterin synthase sulfur carrier subunit
MIKILYFARLREQLVTDAEQVDLPPEVTSVTDLVALQDARGGVWADTFLAGETLMPAVNQEMARPDSPIRDDDEVAISPPSPAADRHASVRAQTGRQVATVNHCVGVGLYAAGRRAKSIRT